ncbi:MAG TPA: 2Fe-2S iron-sulfur cluster-binding protein [Chitinivibrionales bacterium]
MGKEVTIVIDAREVPAHEGVSIIEAADGAGIYIPRLCHHPDLPPGPTTTSSSLVYRGGEICFADTGESFSSNGCGICLVDVEGKGICPACATRVENGMIVRSQTAALLELRRNKLSRILALHPHACMLCAEKGGCNRDDCTEGVENSDRCCAKFDVCELQRVCEYLTIKENVSAYVSRDISVTHAALFTFNPNLCIGCTRCVRACEKTQGKRVIDFTIVDKTCTIGTAAPSFKESGCVLCGACVTVCPTGALMDKGLSWKKNAPLTRSAIVYPPENDLEATDENIRLVPEACGVYQLLDEKRTIIYIRGVDAMRSDLENKRTSVPNARYFRYEEHDMYTMRENELLERFLKKYNTLPEVNNEISDLY